MINPHRFLEPLERNEPWLSSALQALADTLAKVLTSLGAIVTERLYPNMGHAVNHDEIKFVREMMAALVRRPQTAVCGL